MAIHLHKKAIDMALLMLLLMKKNLRSLEKLFWYPMYC